MDTTGNIILRTSEFFSIIITLFSFALLVTGMYFRAINKINMVARDVVWIKEMLSKEGIKR